MLAQSYLHNLDPFAIQFTDGGFGIRWYGLAYVAGFLIAWSLIHWLARTGRSIIPAARVGDFIIYIVVGVLLGGRLGYALFYDPHLFIGFTSEFPWWDLLAINRGGMASHGGIIGSTIAVLIFMKKHRLYPIMHAPDVIAFVAPPGLFLGRMANFINGELWGHPVADQVNPPWWSIKYPEEVYEGTIQVESLQGIVPGDETFLSNIVETVKAGEPAVVDVVVPQLTAFYPSQLFQALADGPILFLVLMAVWWVPRKAGVITGTFLLTYGILRIVTEIFRQPDEGIALLLGLSRGQMLSVFMVAGGLLILILASCAKGPRIGGLGSKGDPPAGQPAAY